MFRPTRKRHVLKRWGLGLLIRKDEMELLLSLRGAESLQIDLLPHRLHLMITALMNTFSSASVEATNSSLTRTRFLLL